MGIQIVGGLREARGRQPGRKVDYTVLDALVVSDQDRSRAFYQLLFDGKVVLERRMPVEEHRRVNGES